RELAFVMESTLWVLPVRPDGTPIGPARQVTREASDAPTWGGNSLLYLHNGTLRMNGRDVPANLTYTPRHHQGVTVIHAGKLWDGESHGLKSDVDIVVVGDRIRAVEPHRADRPSVDATGLTVMPGLVDMHNHQEMRSKYFGDRQGRLLLSYGITTTRSTGDAAYRALEDKESLAAGARIGPRFFMTGEMLEGPRLSWEFARPVMSEAQLGLEVSRAKALDYDLVKTYQRLPAKWQADVTADAHRLGVITTSHYLYPGVAHGVDMQEHLSGPTKWGFGFSRDMSSQGRVYDDAVQLFTRAGMPLSTTLFGSKALLADDPAMVTDPRLRALYTPAQQASLDADLKCALGTGPCGFLSGNAEETRREVAVFKRILDQGGTVVAGTDPPLDNTAVSLHLNLRAMNKYGIDSYRVLRSATADAAQVLGVARDLGTIRAGKIADLSFVVGNPLADVGAAANVRMVMRNGELHTVEDLIGPFE
ncbi:amidohydrolase family protein, partial [Kibdelosporangium lantanae]